MRADDLRVTVRQRKLPCVLDPALVLGSRDGFTLALRLTQVMEPWLTRAFWQVIDASELLMPRLSAAMRENGMLPPHDDALRSWIDLRETTDAGSWPFRWIGDNLAESQVQDGADAGVVERYEAFSEALAARWPDTGGDGWGWDPLRISLDTLALSATLDGALVLTARPDGREPWPVRAFAASGGSATCLDPPPPDSLFAAERALVRDALAAAGLATLSQRLPRLAVMHVSACLESAVGATTAYRLALADGAEADDDFAASAGIGDDEAPNPWRQAFACWYPI